MKALDDLANAAADYGDARAEFEARLKHWKIGDPPPRSTTRDLEAVLLSAARRYATATRKRRSNVAAPKNI